MRCNSLWLAISPYKAQLSPHDTTLLRILETWISICYSSSHIICATCSRVAIDPCPIQPQPIWLTWLLHAVVFTLMGTQSTTQKKIFELIKLITIHNYRARLYRSLEEEYKKRLIVPEFLKTNPMYFV